MPPSRFTAALLAASVALVGCGQNDDPSIVGEPSSATTTTVVEAADGSHNDADVQFAQAMTRLHQDAVAMAALADGRASSPEVLDLAARMEGAQQAEIETMRGWLSVWGGPEEPADTGARGDTGGMDAEAGSGVAALQATADSAFDRAFLERMIAHHGTTIEMAKEELSAGEYGPAVELATEIGQRQTAEIEQMRGLLDEAGG